MALLPRGSSRAGRGSVPAGQLRRPPDALGASLAMPAHSAHRRSTTPATLRAAKPSRPPRRWPLATRRAIRPHAGSLLAPLRAVPLRSLLWA